MDHAFFPRAESDAEDDLGVAIGFEVSWVIEAGEVIDGGVKVDIAVHVVPDGEGGAIDTRKRDGSVKQTRVAKEKVGCVKGSKAASCREDGLWASAVGVDKGYNFFGDVLVIKLVASGAFDGGKFAVEPTLAIHAIYGEDFDAPLFDQGADGFDHPEVFVLVVAAT